MKTFQEGYDMGLKHAIEVLELDMSVQESKEFIETAKDLRWEIFNRKEDSLKEKIT